MNHIIYLEWRAQQKIILGTRYYQMNPYLTEKICL